MNWLLSKITRCNTTNLTPLIFCLFATQCAIPPAASSTNVTAKPVNQKIVAENACGPTALYNSLQFGAPRYQAAAAALPGCDDRAKIGHLIAHHGGKSSQHIRSRKRWSSRGINASDLADIANELKPPLSPRVHMVVPKGFDAWNQSHQSLARSIQRGFPPVAVLRRYAGGTVVESHFITILEVPNELEPEADFFPIRYIDPSGGRLLHGKIHAQQGKSHTQLIAHTPGTPVGKGKVHEPSVLLMDSLIFVQ